ncbi:MAG: TonB-dependent receptor plug domain-containing protein, partial [Bacteroidia bacterium]|nr:TonB-dependent receptor plug domain-containing protein [Bacteroidia bacterium]
MLRLGTVFVLTCLLHFAGNWAYGQCDFLQQRVNFSCKALTAEQCIQKLAQDNHFSVNYISGVFGDQLYTLDIEQQKISSILKGLIRDKNLEYVCLGKDALIFKPKPSLAQTTLSGFVLDSSSKQPVVSALIVNNNEWVEADNDGYFQLNVKRLPTDLLIVSPGFKNAYFVVTEIDEEPDQFLLVPDNRLNTTIVDLYDSLLMVSKTGGIDINMAELSKIPSISGSPGILNSLRFLPSIQSTIEVNGGMVVQGGGKDQNLILFDGMELYNPMHLFGLFSVFDENSIQSISFYKNSFPAQYSGRLSSVLDVKSKVGDFKKWNSKANINPVLLQAVFDGPIVKDKTSLLISGRRSFTDFFPLFYEQIQQQNQLSRFKYFFYDFTGTLNHKVSDKTQLYLSGYLGGDKGYIRSLVDEREVTENKNDFFVQSNRLATAGIKTWINNTMSMHAKIGYSQYGFNHENQYNLLIDLPEPNRYYRETQLGYQSKISDWKTGIYIKTLPRYNNHFKIGLENVWHNFSPSNSQYFLKEGDAILYDTTSQFRDSRILEQRYFIQDVYANKGFRLMAGIHYVNFDNEKSYQSLQPRLNVSIDVKSKNKFEFGFSKTSQFMLQVPNNLLGIPIDIWIPADEHIEPMHCIHFSGGYTRKLNKRLVFKIDAFHKYFDNIIEHKNGVSDFISEWDQALLTGEGRSKGVEFMLKKEKGKINGWLGYTLSKSERSLPSINDGAWYPFQYDRRHDLKCVLHYQYNSNLSFGGTWSYASGNYLTAPEVHYLLNVENQQYLIEQYGSKNNLKLPAYHRLDLGVHHKKEIGNALQTWSFTIYNVYNRQNVFYVN